jgi:hypothetical protein
MRAQRASNEGAGKCTHGSRTARADTHHSLLFIVQHLFSLLGGPVPEGHLVCEQHALRQVLK